MVSKLVFDQIACQSKRDRPHLQETFLRSENKHRTASQIGIAGIEFLAEIWPHQAAVVGMQTIDAAQRRNLTKVASALCILSMQPTESDGALFEKLEWAAPPANLALLKSKS